MKMTKRSRGILCVCAAIFIFAGGVAAYLDYHQKKPLKMVYVCKNNEESDFWSALVAGARMAAEEFDVDLTVLSPDRELEVEYQNDLIDEAIAMNPEVILLTPADYEATLPQAKRIRKEGIGLVLVDSILKENVADAIVATNNHAAGKELGEYAATLVKQDTKIGIVSHVKESSTAIEREKGARAGLREYEDRIVDVVYSDSQYLRAYEVTKAMLQEHQDIDLLIGLNEYSAVGAGRAVRDMELENEVNIVGFDSSQEEIKLLEAGIIDGIIIQRPLEMGYLGVEAAVRIMRKGSAERVTDSGAKLIIKDEIYTVENQKLLFPFWSKHGK